jgi:hypothetical protein
MEIIIEISPTDANKLHINGSKLSFDELRRKIALSELSEALDKTQSAAKAYGLDHLTMDEINNLIKEANADYKQIHLYENIGNIIRQ